MRKMSSKVPKRKQLTGFMTIKQMAIKFPNAKSHAFKLQSSPDYFFFCIREIKRLRAGEIVSWVKVLKMNIKDGDLVVTHLPIKAVDIIQALTIKDFYDRAIIIVNSLKLKYQIEPTPNLKNLIKKYEYHSFRTYRKKAEEIL